MSRTNDEVEHKLAERKTKELIGALARDGAQVWGSAVTVDLVTERVRRFLQDLGMKPRNGPDFMIREVMVRAGLLDWAENKCPECGGIGGFGEPCDVCHKVAVGT